MDQVKVILSYLQKYHFWILCGVAVVASLVGWTMARSSLSADYDKGKAAVGGKLSQLQQIASAENPPNASWAEELKKFTDEQRKIVEDAWYSVYDEQQKALGWPDVMGDQFKQWIAANPDKDIPDEWRDKYQNYAIKEEFPKLLAIVGAAAHDAPKADAGQFKVVWDASNQQDVQKSLAMPTRPNSARVRLAQEDLWVYAALLRIIAETNKTAPYTPWIKKIQQLKIGVDAAKLFEDGMASGHIDLAQTAGGDAAGAEAAPTYAEPAGEGVEAALDDGRYVDEAGKKQAGGTAQGQQFKRMPVYLSIEMDQRKINELLTACANYPLPVEVRQFRINPEKGKSNTGQPAGQRGAPAGAAGPGQAEKDPLDVEVEIHGIIYIYNPPDGAKLGTPEEGSGNDGGNTGGRRRRRR